MLGENNCGDFNESLKPSEERIRLEEERVRLKEDNARQGRKQREKDISQIRREAVNARWSKARANAEASTATESYKAANAVALQTQNIVRQPYWNAGRKAVQLPYRPTEEQVREYMQTVLHLRPNVAEEEARRFLYYNDAHGWKFSGTTRLNWEGAVQLWVSRLEERRGKTIYMPQLSEEQRQAEERKSVDKEIDVKARAYVHRIMYNLFAGEEGKEALEALEMINAGEFSEDRFGHVAKRAGELLIDLWAWTYAEKIIMEDYTNEDGKAAKGIKEFLDSGKFSTSWYWHGVEMRVKYYLEHWEKGPGRPIKRLAPLNSNDKKGVPEHWKCIKTLMDRNDYSGGFLGARARNIADKAERNDFSGGEDGQIAEWIVTGKVPTRPSQTASASPNQPQPLKGIINKALRNIEAQT